MKGNLLPIPFTIFLILFSWQWGSIDEICIDFWSASSGKNDRRTGVRKITGLKLFHNHMTIELLVPYLGFTEEMWKLSDRFRMDFLKL